MVGKHLLGRQNASEQSDRYQIPQDTPVEASVNCNLVRRIVHQACRQHALEIVLRVAVALLQCIGQLPLCVLVALVQEAEQSKIVSIGDLVRYGEAL